MNSTNIRLKNKIIQKRAHKLESIEKTSETRTYTSTIKTLLKSAVLILRLKLFNELKSVSAGRLFHGATTRSAKNKGGGALCAGNAVALLVFGPVMP